MVDIRLQSKGRPTGAGGRVLGQLEEYFVEQLSPGDTFVFAGEVLRFEGHARGRAPTSPRTKDTEAQMPSYNGGKFPLSTFLAQRVREMVSRPESWHVLPDPVHEWLRIQEWRGPSCRSRGNCWWRRFRAAARNISSAIRSRGAWRTRRWACC